MLSLPAVEVQHETGWLVLMPSGQAGPFSAAHMAELFDQANLDWTSLVWRSGLKGWRPARRDPQLITAVSSARGASAWGDTQRVPVKRSILPAADTIVDPPPGMSIRGDAFTAPYVRDETATSDYATRVAQRFQFLEQTREETFSSASRRLAPPTALHPSAEPVTARRSAPSSWLPTSRSMLLVALLAFGAGVSFAALWGRAQRPGAPRAAAAVVVRPASAGPFIVTEPLISPQNVSNPVPEQLQGTAEGATPPLAETPSHVQLRREIKRVSPDVRRCVDDLSTGAEVEVSFEGPTGRARDVRLRTPGLSAGRSECITQAVRQMQVDPFSRATYKLGHRFSY